MHGALKVCVKLIVGSLSLFLSLYLSLILPTDIQSDIRKYSSVTIESWQQRVGMKWQGREEGNKRCMWVNRCCDVAFIPLVNEDSEGGSLPK